MSWLERLTGGFKKTADRLGENLSGLVKEQALDTVLPHLSQKRCRELATECVELYLWDRLGSDN